MTELMRGNPEAVVALFLLAVAVAAGWFFVDLDRAMERDRIERRGGEEYAENWDWRDR